MTIMNNPHDSRAKRMFEVISQAPMSVEVRRKFQTYAEANDAKGIWDYFQKCLESKSSVGVSVENAGKKSFEQIHDVVERIYKKKNTKEEI